jgi:hypothetical protein
MDQLSAVSLRGIMNNFTLNTDLLGNSIFLLECQGKHGNDNPGRHWTKAEVGYPSLSTGGDLQGFKSAMSFF